MHNKALLVPLSLLLNACVMPYYLDTNYKDTKAVSDIKGVSAKLAYITPGSTTQSAVGENYNNVQARCLLHRNAIIVEREGIKRRNLALGAVWVGITTSLAFANGVYNLVAKEQANSAVSSVLGMAAGGTSIPSFFYLGSDQREKELDKKLDQTTAALEQLYKLPDQLAAATIKHERDNAGGSHESLKCREFELEVNLGIQENMNCSEIYNDKREAALKQMQEKAKKCLVTIQDPCSAKKPNASPKWLAQLETWRAELKTIREQNERLRDNSSKNTTDYNEILKNISNEVTHLQTKCQ